MAKKPSFNFGAKAKAPRKRKAGGRKQSAAQHGSMVREFGRGGYRGPSSAPLPD